MRPIKKIEPIKPYESMKIAKPIKIKHDPYKSTSLNSKRKIC